MIKKTKPAVSTRAFLGFLRASSGRSFLLEQKLVYLLYMGRGELYVEHKRG